MKTSYNHFIEYLVDSHISSNKFNDLFDLRGDFSSYTEYRERHSPLVSIISQPGHIYNPYIYIKQDFSKEIIKDISLKNWCDIENRYFELLNSEDEKSKFYNNPKKLNDEFEILKCYLSDYLEEQEKSITAIGSYKKLFELVDSKDTTLLNFNYTDTLRTLYSNELEESKVIHIHGELSNPLNPIIFGFAANDEESRELIDKGDNEYMRNIKKHLYKRTENERLLTNYLEGTKDIDVTILGHSCGLSDKLILNQILNHKNIKTINVFYYEIYENYFQTQVNIDRIMNRDEHFEKLVDFNSSHRMPQYNDTEDQYDSFFNYTTRIVGIRKLAKKAHKMSKIIENLNSMKS